MVLENCGLGIINVIEKVERKTMYTCNYLLKVLGFDFDKVMFGNVLQGDPVPCERCGGNGNYLSAFELKHCCALVLNFREIIET